MQTDVDQRAEESRKLNAWLEDVIASMPSITEVPAQETRQARLEGKSAFPVPERLDAGVDRTIPGRGVSIGLRVFTPSVVTGVVLHIHGGGWTFGANHRYTPSSTFSMSTSTSTSPRGTLTCATLRRR